MILRPQEVVDEQCIVLTMYPRVPTGSLVFMETPAGMLDGDTGNLVGKAAKEVYEETGFIIPPTELIDMTQMALEGSKTQFQNHLEKATYLSPGRSDGYLRLLLWEKVIRKELGELSGQLTGLRARGELITVALCRYEEFWREGARDAKILAALALEKGLKRARRI